jgi:30S ribosomal protein S31
MGKGDMKTKRGKISAGSYGRLRRKKSTASTVVTPTPVEEKPKPKKTPKAKKPKKDEE